MDANVLCTLAGIAQSASKFANDMRILAVSYTHLLEVFNQIAAIMRETGVPVLGIVMDEELATAQETLKYIKFPVIVYNDAMKSSLGKYEDILDDALTFVFTKDGGFYTAWNTNVDKEKILEVADWIAKEK